MSSRLVITIILFVNISNFLKWNKYPMTFSVWHRNTWDDSFVVCKGHIWLSILMTSVVCLHFSMKEDDVLEHTNIKCHLCTLSQHVGHYVLHAYTSQQYWSYSCQYISKSGTPSVMRWHRWWSCSLACAWEWDKSHYYAHDTKYHRQCSAKEKPSWRRLLYYICINREKRIKLKFFISQTSK